MSTYLVCGWDTDELFLQNAAVISDHDNRQRYLRLACFILHYVRPCLMFFWNDIHTFFPLCADSSSVRQKRHKEYTHSYLFVSWIVSTESAARTAASLIDEHCMHTCTWEIWSYFWICLIVWHCWQLDADRATVKTKYKCSHHARCFSVRNVQSRPNMSPL